MTKNINLTLRKELVRLLDAIFRIIKPNTNNSCYYENLRAYILKSKVRFSSISGTFLFQVLEKKRAISVVPNLSIGRQYLNGLDHRLINLGNSYSLEDIDFQTDNLVIDIGANVGDLYKYLKLIRQVNLSYIGYEPGPKEFACLCKNVYSNKNRTFQIAIHNTSEKREFFYDSQTANSSLIAPPNFENILKIGTFTLDEHLKIIGITEARIKLIKIETEGTEPEVLEGAIKTIIKTDFVAVDVGFERGIYQESTKIPVFKFLQQNNFELFKIGSAKHRFLFKNLMKLNQ